MREIRAPQSTWRPSCPRTPSIEKVYVRCAIFSSLNCPIQGHPLLRVGRNFSTTQTKHPLSLTSSQQAKIQPLKFFLRPTVNISLFIDQMHLETLFPEIYTSLIYIFKQGMPCRFLIRKRNHIITLIPTLIQAFQNWDSTPCRQRLHRAHPIIVILRRREIIKQILLGPNSFPVYPDNGSCRENCWNQKC